MNNYTNYRKCPSCRPGTSCACNMHSCWCNSNLGPDRSLLSTTEESIIDNNLMRGCSGGCRPGTSCACNMHSCWCNSNLGPDRQNS
jgi:hypothetical protein